MQIEYGVMDAKRYRVDPVWQAGTADIVFYRNLVEKAGADFSVGDQYPGRGVSEGNQMEPYTGSDYPFF